MLKLPMPPRLEFIAKTPLQADAAEASATELALGPQESAGAATPPLTRHRRPLFALTGLRFFAASYVVAFHTRLAVLLLEDGYPHLSLFFRNGYLAVTLFFILSGFILAYTYRGQMAEPGAATRFWEARFARLWPAYAFSLVCSSLPGMPLPPWRLALATLAMVQAWNPWHPEFAGTWNFVCWTLSVEAFFYLLFPWIQRGLERLRPTGVALFGLLTLCLGVLCNVSARTLGDSQYPAPWNHVPLPVIHLPEFLVGAALGNLFVLLSRSDESKSSGQPRWPVYTSFGLALSLVALATVHNALTSLALVPFALLIFGLASERSLLARALSAPALLLGGAVSYSVYLLQTPVRTLIHRVAALELGWPGLVFVPLALFPLAYLVYHYVEEPSRLGLRRLFAAAHRLRRVPS